LAGESEKVTLKFQALRDGLPSTAELQSMEEKGDWLVFCSAPVWATCSQGTVIHVVADAQDARVLVHVGVHRGLWPPALPFS
jgi:hypothetical protein